MKVEYTLPETLINVYILDVDETKLKGCSIEEYLKQWDNNPWKAKEFDPESPIKSIELDRCEDVVAMDLENAKICEIKDSDTDKKVAYKQLEEEWEERVYKVTKIVSYDENGCVIKEEKINEELKEITDSGPISEKLIEGESNE